jgi:diaminopimelate epimerase
MELAFSKVSPGGNLTILIWDIVPREQHALIANTLMDNQKHLGAEQVGYIEPSTNPKALAHLQMMGGEFCGNATRALAYMLVRKKYFGVEIKNKFAEFYLTVSGVSKELAVKVECDDYDIPIGAEVEMPIYQDLSSVEERIFNQDKYASIVKLEGITHIIVDESDYPFDNDEYQNQLKYLRRLFGLEDEEALGVMWKDIDPNSNEIHMKPVVWVKATDSYYYETSCGSGTVALALAKSKKSLNSIQEYQVKQPSNNFITAVITRETYCFTNAHIGGSVILIADGKVFL